MKQFLVSLQLLAEREREVERLADELLVAGASQDVNGHAQQYRKTALSDGFKEQDKNEPTGRINQAQRLADDLSALLASKAACIADLRTV